MAKLKEYNGRYCESEYEYAFLGFLEAEGWQYLSGNEINRSVKRDVLIEDDCKMFMTDTNPDLTEDEVAQIFDAVRLVGSESDFATLHKVYGWMVDGVQFVPQDGMARMVSLIDFEDPSNNIFRAVNQFTVEYSNNGQKENRRPDVLLFVNGMPLCVIELKNPADARAEQSARQGVAAGRRPAQDGPRYHHQRAARSRRVRICHQRIDRARLQDDPQVPP